ncbi:hypothetical protein BVG16_06820 [Paenibacillus selenitireducens]|uniref:Uncharacterized protein n=1 Tax=Paenibacillus selenitireducens TaxID=1324314 RepID=A0A1T2XKN7_9BACL|nr:hypothetical protein [Paenibacillus selenitireducens]OPA80437.1 hypothetical protein BVG16_06820 [Paenibacillus selenitireducens]
MGKKTKIIFSTVVLVMIWTIMFISFGFSYQAYLYGGLISLVTVLGILSVESSIDNSIYLNKLQNKNKW